MAYNQHDKLIKNIAAVKAAIKWEQHGPLNADELAALRLYSGFGGIKAILLPFDSRESWTLNGGKEADFRLYEPMMEFHELLKSNYSEKEYDAMISSLKNSVLTSFYTPQFVPATLFTTLSQHGLQPINFYEPSSGAGVFIDAALAAFPSIKTVQAVEKDLLCGKVIQAIGANLSPSATVSVCGLEDTGAVGRGQYDLIASNIPFGNFQVFDPLFPDKQISGKIHNYFFAKGLDKLADGGILAYITTDAFLNNPSNLDARRYLFSKADFISLAVMPDNLMKDTGNTEAPNHLIIVQRNEQKNSLSDEEKLLIASFERAGDFGPYQYNRFIDAHSELLLGDEIKDGKNQYGLPSRQVWQHGDLTGISGKLSSLISEGITERLNLDRFQSINFKPIQKSAPSKTLSFLPVPEMQQQNAQLQLGLFDSIQAEVANRALAYLSEQDKAIIIKDSARLVSVIKTEEKPAHESIVMLVAQSQQNKRYVYKLYSNVAEVNPPKQWLNGSLLSSTISELSDTLKDFAHTYIYEGDQTLEAAFELNRKGPSIIKNLQPYHRNGMLALLNGKIGKIDQLDGGVGSANFYPLDISSNRTIFYREYIDLRDLYLKFNYEDQHEASRSSLRDTYVSFVDRYGFLNHPSNRSLILEDSPFGLMILSSLERREAEHFVQADVLRAALEHHQSHFTTDDPSEALARCLNDKGKVDISFMEAATGLSSDEVIQALSHHILLNPETGAWETRDQYLSGNVVAKLVIAQRAASGAPENELLSRSLDELLKVQPEKIPFELLDFNLGERWIPTDFYSRFATQLFELDTNVSYYPSLDTFKVTTKGTNPKVAQEYAIRPKSGRQTPGGTILEHALENTTPFYTYEVESGDKTIRVPDNEAIQLAHQKIESIRARFVDWLTELPATDKQRLEQLYNDTFNCYVLREYDGSHQLFPGFDKKSLGIEDLYSSQKNAVWRIVQNRGALIDHEVGLGKTLTMIVAAQEMKRLGIIQKPMILALKSNVPDIRNTYRKAYPTARLLAPNEDDFTPAKRQRLVHEIRNNNWDCIIITHDQFAKIQQAPEIQQQIFEAELDNIEKDLATIRESGGEISKGMLKGLEIRKTNLESKLKEIAVRLDNKRDEDIDFMRLGVDHLFVDESHKFKNLTFTTRHNRVAGLGNMEGSQKALNMLFAVRTLQDKFQSDLCVTFLSGTPISNSLTEMYLIFKYLRPREMERQCIDNFDAWAAVFARKTTDFEFSVTNEIIAKERFRHFIKVPELALFYNEITDYKTAQHINLDKPVLKEQLVNLKPNPEQQEFIRNLMEFARTGNGQLIGREPLSPDEDKGRMLIATNYAKKMAADMRLISDKYSDHPDNKVSACARTFADLYHLSAPFKGTQVIFCDIGTPKPHEFNLYDALKEKLVRDFNIPPHEITFIHDWNDKRRPELFRKMNNGEIRCLIGSTDKAGTGLNVQKRIVAMHHIDIPWKPSELEQRNGRGARQGNWLARTHYNNQVLNFIYATEQSLDNYKFNLLKNKQTFIAQMKNCELNVRSIDEGALDEKSGMNFSEYIAILSGDTSLLEKSRLEKKIAVIESLKKAHFKELSRARYQLEDTQKSLEETKVLIQRLCSDQAAYKSRLSHQPDGSKANPIVLKGCKSNDAELIGKYIIQVYQTWTPEQEALLGTLYSFNLYIRQHKELIEQDKKLQEHRYNSLYAERPESGIKYTYNQGHPNVDNPKLAARHFLNAIDRVDNLLEKYMNTRRDQEREIPLLEGLVNKPFEKDKELADLKLQLASLERQISINIQAKLMQENGLFNAQPDATKEATVIDLPQKMKPEELKIIQIDKQQPQLRRKSMRL